ncbi:MAG: radical SAM protein [Candidatus Altiarchaeota archaeon]
MGSSRKYVEKHLHRLLGRRVDPYHDCNKYDVLMIHPKSDRDYNIQIPSSLLAVAGSLVREGYSVKILDQRIERDCFGDLDRMLAEGVICVGLTFMPGNQIKYACELIDYVKENYPKTPVVVGGHHATMLSSQTIDYKNIDVVVVGEGEETLLELVKVLERNGNLKSVKGILYKENGKIIQTPERELIDLNDYYPLPYSLIGRYKASYIWTIFTSRGCPRNCAYCSIPMLNKKYRTLKPELAIYQIKQLLAIGAGPLYFLDDNLFADMGRVERILDLIIKERLSFNWWGECRADDLLKMSSGFLEKLKKSGMCRVYIGAESGSDRILKLIRKGITVDMIRQANLRLKEVGIVPEFTFMAGFPTEIEEEFNNTLDLIRELKTDNPDAIVWKMSMYTPYPGTELFELAVRGGFVLPDSLKGWAEIDWYRKDFSVEYDDLLV